MMRRLRRRVVKVQHPSSILRLRVVSEPYRGIRGATLTRRSNHWSLRDSRHLLRQMGVLTYAQRAACDFVFKGHRHSI